jgi:FkbM family methyltransferase
LDGEANILEFRWSLLGTRFIVFNLRFLKGITYRLLKRRLIKVQLPDGNKIFVRNTTYDIYVVDEIYRECVYDKHYQPTLGNIVFDLGTHIGIYALNASRLVGSKGNVYAFEPEPDNFALLRRNMVLNKTSNITVSNNAVSSRQGKLALYMDPRNTGAHSVRCKDGKTGSIFVSSITLDEIMKVYPVKEINLLKIDVEGHELEVLKGAESFLGICDNIAMEKHERIRGPRNEQISGILEKYGFRTEIVRYSEFNDLLYAWK